MKKNLLPFFLFIFSFATVAAQNNLYKEKYRPQFHFSPAKNWTNDPNGLVYYKGEYHLFYQYNPFGNRWGHMTWAHSVSKDLVHWQQLPIAIREENKIMIFSGSAVVDENNTSGFAKNSREVPMVAVYTGHYTADTSKPDDNLQAQNIAYSLDKGRSWKKYDGNPVLDLHKKDFRDPKVFWYAPNKKWIMLVVLPHEHIVQFYSSPDLKQWTHISDFGPAGDVNDIWECPDLLQVPVKGEPGKSKWVIVNSEQTRMQYFVGEFDGKHFINGNPTSNIYRPDYGPDYYAAITYNNLPAGHAPILLGWANNWEYANDIPTFPWKSAMALPRELSLKKEKNEWILLQQPVSEIKKLRMSLTELKDLTVTKTKKLFQKGQQFEMETEFIPYPNGKSGVRLAVSKNNFFVIGYNATTQKLFIDRSGCSNNSFNKKFAALTYYETSLVPVNGKIKLHLFFDNSIVEVFVNDGIAVMTAQLFPDEIDNGIELFSDDGASRFSSVRFWNMRSAW